MSESFLAAVVRGLAAVAIACGAAGMGYTMVFLWSSNMEDLVGAGFPFVGASVLLAGGLVAMALTLNPARDVARSPLAAQAEQLAEARRQLDAARDRLEFEERATRAAIRPSS